MIEFHYEIVFGVEIKIRLGKDMVAEQSFVRRYMNLGVRYQDIYDKHFQGRLFYDEKLRRAPAVIIVSGSEGRIEKAQNIAQLLSSRGYICLAIAYFGLEGLSQNLEPNSDRMSGGSERFSMSSSSS